MRICSFDIGIKNLALCKLEIINNTFKIIDWQVINLFKDEPNDGELIKCNVNLKNGNKCSSNAEYYIKDISISYMCNRHYKDNNNIKKLCTVKSSTIIELAKLVIKALDNIDFSDCDEIILEQQPKMATDKMRTISIIIMNYFIIKYMPYDKLDNKLNNVQFINPSNKLTVYDGPFIECNLKGQYARNKFYAKKYCEYIIRSNLEAQKIYNSYKKKDDLSDCFLQGLWYLMTLPKSDNKCLIVEDKYEYKMHEERNEEMHENTKKIKINFNSNASIKNLSEIKNSDTFKQTLYGNNFNKYKNITRTIKPTDKQSKYTLNNIKYYVNKFKNINKDNDDDKLFNMIDSNYKLQSSINFFFGSLDNFKSFLNT